MLRFYGSRSNETEALGATYGGAWRERESPPKLWRIVRSSYPLRGEHLEGLTTGEESQDSLRHRRQDSCYKSFQEHLDGI